jgi:hypothetical protein
MTAAAMELLRLDPAKKPMFVVPNHLVLRISVTDTGQAHQAGRHRDL